MEKRLNYIQKKSEGDKVQQEKFYYKIPSKKIFLILAYFLGITVHDAWGESKVVISGVYFIGRYKGQPEPDEAVRISNLDLKRAVDISGWKISDRYFILRKKSRRGEIAIDWSRNRGERAIRLLNRRRRGLRGISKGESRGAMGRTAQELEFPRGTIIPPGGSIWVAYRGKEFRAIFGRAPDFEGEDTLRSVPEIRIYGGWPYMFSTRGILSLHDSRGRVVDVVCYANTREDTLDLSAVPKEEWKGPPVRLYRALPYSWRGLVLSRDRDERGNFLPDTDSSEDWDSGFSATKLGKDPAHRVERAGQSFFYFPKVIEKGGEIIVTSAPENNFAALVRAFSRARREILINVYQWTNIKLARALLRARRRGIKITVLMEGSPVGGVAPKSWEIAEMFSRRGIRVYWMKGDKKKKRFRRYRYNHAKYAIIDRRWVIIGTENYGRTGHPSKGTFGNRGWEIQIRSKKLAAQLLKVFREDTDIRRFRDVWTHREFRRRFRKPKRRNKPPVYWSKGGRNRCEKIPPSEREFGQSVLHLRGKRASSVFQLVLSPDNSLSERGSIIGTILNCRREVLILQNSIPLYWGRKPYRSIDRTPNLPLMAVLEAARRGCRVRVLIDSVWYHIRGDNPRDNDDTVRWLNEMARREKLDLYAKLINLPAAKLSKIHAKGVIVDREYTFVGSINWSENSFKGNREVGVIIKNRYVARLYAKLFEEDWLYSRIFRLESLGERVPIYSIRGGRKRLKVGGFFCKKAKLKFYRYLNRGELVDVLAEEGEFYQIRLGKRGVGCIAKRRKGKRVFRILFTSYEAMFQVGRFGVVIGSLVPPVKKYRKLVVFSFSPRYPGGLKMVIWKNQHTLVRGEPVRLIRALREKYGSLEALVNRCIRVRGKISFYKGSPQLVVRNIDDILVEN